MKLNLYSLVHGTSSSETQGLWVDFKSGRKSLFGPDLKSTHSPWVSDDDGTCAEQVFWWQRRKFGFKVYSERFVFSRDLITIMSSRITVTNICFNQWVICFKLWRGLWFMLCRNGTQLNYIIQCLFNLITSYLFFRHDESRSMWCSRW